MDDVGTRRVDSQAAKRFVKHAIGSQTIAASHAKQRVSSETSSSSSSVSSSEMEHVQDEASFIPDLEENEQDQTDSVKLVAKQLHHAKHDSRRVSMDDQDINMSSDDHSKDKQDKREKKKRNRDNKMNKEAKQQNAGKRDGKEKKRKKVAK